MPKWICAECGCRYYGWSITDKNCSLCGGKVVAADDSSCNGENSFMQPDLEAENERTETHS